ncbi:hypothetical protein J2T12_001642 [Paenibacillus anaericanus]|uniref:Uncharacterized protein n=1 Tax=Paenibacillus anaericanus TaxID=170367 RepID=A0A3S1BR69_9BACL|nr:hypothetical protein [Paenibacillus anaericanus]MDQ0088236.1 hypothetical protein [Paenibacillus anaericanus]RUT47780.1 hypothetical protein EJP82_05205 [Paenibacillus anaericanus]
MKKQFIIFWVTIGLAVFYLVDFLFLGGGKLNLGSFLPPVLVLGIIFWLYKFPPKKYRKSKHPKVKPSARTMAKVAAERRQTTTTGSGQKRKHYPFQVIEGQKGKNDDTPKYH